MDKKKKSTKPITETEEIIEHTPESSSAPTFVTEVVEEDGETETIESLEAKASEEAYNNTEESQELPKKDTQDAPIEEIHQESPEKDKKQVVEELFSSKPNDQLVEISINKQKNSQPLIVWAIIIIAVALLTGGGMLLITRTTGQKKELTVKPTPTVAQANVSPSPTSAPIKRDTLKIQVLNGGGKAGAASKMKSFLTDKGYTVTATGNTEQYSYDKTEIDVKSGNETLINLLKEDLSKDYSIGTTAASLLSDSPYDARVIVGKE